LRNYERLLGFLRFIPAAEIVSRPCPGMRRFEATDTVGVSWLAEDDATFMLSIVRNILNERLMIETVVRC
jgi:hypothetical protein